MAENKNNNKEELPIVFTTVHGNGDFKFKKPIENVKYIKLCQIGIQIVEI